MIPDLDRGIALLCDESGLVQRVVRDELGLAERVPVGRSITALADEAVLEKARRFLAALQAHGAAFDWEITVPLAGRLVPLHLAAC